MFVKTKPTRSWLSLWLTSSLGCALLVSGCASVIVSPRPKACPPLTDEILNEYDNLIQVSNEIPTSQLRAWVREADKACRANELLLKD